MTNDQINFDGLAYFLYRSTAVDGLDHDDLQKIRHGSEQRNTQNDLSGCLHYEDGLFFQWLEGPSQSLKPVRKSIMRDIRHRDIAVLGEGTLDARLFQGWRMRFSDRKQGSLLDWFAQSNVSTVDRSDYNCGVIAFLQTVSV